MLIERVLPNLKTTLGVHLNVRLIGLSKFWYSIGYFKRNTRLGSNSES
ncbi:hypothetical protein [Arcicella aurantiaca]|nr:hypothetical protein [Arcicella aurantiaca]